MKKIAASFIDYLPTLPCGDSDDAIGLALQQPGVIDTAVYRKNSSIRVCHSIKLKDPDRAMRIVNGRHCGDGAKSYVTNVSDESVVVVVQCDDSGRRGESDQECQLLVMNILKSALKKKVVTVKSMSPVVGGNGTTFTCVVRGHRRCGVSKTRHSHDTDIYFIVDILKPYVTQKCFSVHCGGGEKVYMHNEGAFGPMQRSAGVKPELVIDYLKEVANCKFSDDDAEKKVMIEKYVDVVYEHYYNRFFCVITDEREFLIGVKYISTTSGRAMKRTTKPREFAMQRCTVPFIEGWMKSVRRREVQTVDFFPWDESMITVRHSIGVCHVNAPTEIVHSPMSPKPFFNEFCGLAINHRDAWGYEYSKDEVAPFVMHIINVWAGGDQEIAEWILQWLASVYQRPWVRLDTAIILQGPKGCGKGIIVEHLAALIGPQHYWQIGNLNNLTGNYTHPKFQKACIGFVDEAYWGGDPKSANALKGIITEKTQDSNVKYKAQKSFNSYMNVIIASNNDRIVEYTSDNRRYQFLKMKPVDFESTDDERAYFDRLKGVPSLAIASFLLRRVCTCSFNNKKIFKTSAATDQLIESFTPIETWWYHELCASMGDNDEDDADDSVFGTKTPIKFLRERMINHTRENGQRYSNVGTGRAFTSRMAMMCPSIGKSVRMYIGPGTQVRGLNIPVNLTCRQEFDAYTKHTIDYSL